MPVFTALEVQPFSGFYPSCQQCLRRLSVTEKPGKGEHFHCRGCGIAYYKGAVEWRYCVRVTAQCGQERRDMVVFGDRLNAVFGAPAAELRRFLFSCFPESLSLLSPLGLCQFLLEPLQSVLSGRCFTANLTVSRNTRSEGKQEKRPTARYVATGFQLLGGVVSMSVVSIVAQEVGRCLIAGTLSNTSPVPNMFPSVPLTQKHEEQDCDLDDSSSTSIGHSLMCSLQTISSQQVMLDFHSLLSVSDAYRTSQSYSKSLPTAQEKGSLSCPLLTNDSSAFEFLVSPNQCKTDSFCPKCGTRSPSCAPLSLDLAALCDEAVDDMIATQGHHQSHDLLNSFMSPCTQSNGMSFPEVGMAFCTSSSQSTSYTYDEVLPDSESFLAEFQGDFEPSLVCRASSSHSPSSLAQDKVKSHNPLPPTQGGQLKPLKECTPSTGSRHGWQVPPLYLQSASTPAGCGLLTVLGCSPELFTGSITNSPVVSAAEYFSPELFSSPCSVSPPPTHSTSSMLQLAAGVHASSVGVHASSVGVYTHTPAVGSGFRGSINPRRNILEGNGVGASSSPNNSKTALGSLIKH